MDCRFRTGRSVVGDSATGRLAAWTVEGRGPRLDLSPLPDPRGRAAVARALAFDPGERFRSCSKFVNRLPT